ncbi:MAG: MotA/TolQ/ExbB proton channel family protein [Deltaproteobacteria bacterium]|nr:MAG: MotA/TolQ/ExbB proton channel family protein [Deltaproteobacteria bacterium]
MHGLFDQIRTYFQQGGFVMWPLLVGAALMWYGLGYRVFALRRGVRMPVRLLVERYLEGWDRPPEGVLDAAAQRAAQVAREGRRPLRRQLDDALADLHDEMSRFRTLVRAIVTVAPLTGLLGTVAGMIETFDSLGDMSLYSQSGGIAGGISQALFTTQMGLVVAVPGLFIGRILSRKQQSLEMEIARIKDLICARFAEAGP